MIYSIEGQIIDTAYDISGSLLNMAYDSDGNQIYSASDLKVMSYNVGGWYDGSGTNVPTASDSEWYAMQNGIIADNDADIICFNEYWNQFSANRTALSMLSQYYPYIEARNGNSQYFGRAIASKYPIESYTQNQYTQDTDRYYDKAVINVNGTLINVIVTHLGLTVANRQAEALQLFNYVQSLDTVIVCGDMNINIHSQTDSEWVNCYKQFIDAGYHMANCSDADFGFKDTYYRYSEDNWWPFDNIIVSSDITIDSVYVDMTKAEEALAPKLDHMPIIANLTIN